MTRREIADALEDAGVNINHARVEETQKMSFIAGLIRAAEETLLVACNILRDGSVPDSEL